MGRSLAVPWVCCGGAGQLWKWWGRCWTRIWGGSGRVEEEARLQFCCLPVRLGLLHHMPAVTPLQECCTCP